MSRRGRAKMQKKEHINPQLDMPDGVSDALEELRKINEEEISQKAEPVRKKALPELKDLVLFGKIIETVKYGNYDIKLSTLSNRQQQRLIKKLMKLDKEDRVMNVKTFTLAEAIISINDISLEDLYQEEQKLPADLKKIEVVSDFQSNLVEKLFEDYESLVEKSNNIFEEGDLGDKVKN